MEFFTVRFADSAVTIGYDSPEAGSHLSLLFGDISGGVVDDHPVLRLLYDCNSSEHLLSEGATLLHRGTLGVQFAAHLYDTIIFHLLNRARTGIALHAGGLVCGGRTVLLPGQSGAGKSTLTAWLTARQCCYLTDELIFISIGSPGGIAYLRRPLCLKSESRPLIENLLTPADKTEILADRHGALIPHRLLNPTPTGQVPAPSLIVVPNYRPESEPQLEHLTKARLTTLLMGCHVNARNLVDHGFKEIINIARSTPAYRLTYKNMQEAEELFIGLVND